MLSSPHLEAKPKHVSPFTASHMHVSGEWCAGEADAIVNLIQLTDVDDKGIRNSGPGVAHICKPREKQPMRSPEPNEQKAL